MRLFNEVRNSDLAWFITSNQKAQPAYAQNKLIHITHTQHKNKFVEVGGRANCKQNVMLIYIWTSQTDNLHITDKDRECQPSFSAMQPGNQKPAVMRVTEYGNLVYQPASQRARSRGWGKKRDIRSMTEQTGSTTFLVPSSHYKYHTAVEGICHAHV